MQNPFAEIDSKVRSFMDRSLRGEASEEEFNQLALELYRLQNQFNPAYTKLCGSHPRVVKDWREIPAAPTVAFKEFDLTSLPLDERQRVFLSSGTTQKNRGRHYHNSDSLSLYTDSLRSWFHCNFRKSHHIVDAIFLTPRSVDAPNSSLAYMFETFAVDRDQFLNVPEFYGRVDSEGNWDPDLDALIDHLRDFDFQHLPVVIFGTAFLFVHLLDALASKNISLSLSQGSWILETGGYKGRSREVSKEELHRMIQERLGIPPSSVFGEYGMSELSSQAYDRADGIFHFPPWTRTVLVSPATGKEVADGERGLIRVYDLANIYSVMAVQTEDIGIRVGDGFRLAGRAAQAEARGCSLMTL
jgi:hypothetical protein